MSEEDGELGVALVLGGHPIDVPATLDVFESTPGVRVYPQDLSSFVSDMGDARGRYDIAVFNNFHGHGVYVDLVGDAYDRAMETVRGLGDDGLGIVALHHGIAAFPESAEWEDVCGLSGSSLSNAHQAQTFTVDVEDRGHPITEGLASFEMTDETYTMGEPDADSHVLLTTEHDPSMEALAWTRRYRNSRVFCYESGHDASAFATPEFRTVLERGLRWVAPSE